MAQQAYSPVIEELTARDVAAVAAANGITAEQAFERLWVAREKAIRNMARDPIYHGWRPPIVEVVEALLGVPWQDADLGAAYRRTLGFDKPVRSLLILGGNRSGKTRTEGELAMRTLLGEKRARAWMFHMTHQNSVEYHHSMMWELVPAVWRRKIKSDVEYLSYNQQMGFSSDKFVLANGSECSFRNYSQDRRDAIEGGEPNIAVADELIPSDWVLTLEMRLATRNGVMLVGFTPVDGYTGTVAMFCDGASVAWEETAFLLPKDGMEPRADLALGLTAQEYAEVNRANDEGRPPRCPPCRPTACREWLDGKSGQSDVPAGRSFERVPRVLRCADPRRAVVFYHSSDNPFGNPIEVVNKVAGRPLRYVRERYYGIAEKLVAARFAMFDERVHVILPPQIPEAGTNWHIVDPCSGRAFFMLWIRATPDGKHFVYREWPGNYYIPGVGIPEPWAEASTGNRMDGAKGAGQKAPGWGLAGYKAEIERVEGRGGDGKLGGENYEKDERSETKETGEVIEARYMDARFANTKSFEEGGMVTLLEKFDEVGLTFYDSSSGGTGKWTIRDGEELVDDALAWDATRKMEWGNEPRLYVSAECRNLIFALKTWTGADGQDGATKDPIDCLRMYFLKGCGYVAPREEANQEGGRGCY